MNRAIVEGYVNDGGGLSINRKQKVNVSEIEIM